MHYNRTKFIAGLGTLVFGAFIMTILFLPTKSSYSYSNALEGFFIKRTDWGIALGIFFAGLIISAAIVLIVESFIYTGKSNKKTNDDK